MPAPLPLLVVVGGIPGSGKSTVAAAIGEALHVPVLQRDLVKTGIHVTHASTDPAEQHRFADRAFETAFAAVDALLDGGSSVVLEAAFHRDRSGPPLRRLAQRSRMRAVWTTCPPDVAASRYRARGERGERHPAHNDLAVADRMDAGGLDWTIYDPPPDLPLAARVDTSRRWSLDELLPQLSG